MNHLSGAAASRITCLLIALAATPAIAQPSSWATVRHDNERTGRSPIIAAQTETTVHDQVSICCTPETPSNPVSGPDGTVYFSIGDNLRAVDPTTGTVLWSVPEAGTAPVVAPDGAIIVNTASAGDTVSTGFVRAFEPDGALRWSYETLEGGASINRDLIVGTNGIVYGTYGAVVQQQPVVYANFRFALNIDGSLLWKTGGVGELNAFIPPAIADDGAIFQIGNSAEQPQFFGWKLRRLDPADGSVVWSAPCCADLHVMSVPIISGDHVIVSIRDINSFPYHASLVAFDRETGAEAWSLEYDDPFGIYSISGYYAQPVILGNGEILAFWDKIYRVAPDGLLVATAPFPAEMGRRSVPIAGGDDTIYVWTATAAPGAFIAFSPFTGSVKFGFTPADSGCLTTAEPVILSDGAIFLTWHRRTVCEDFSGTVKFITIAPPLIDPCVCGDNEPPTAVIAGDAVVMPNTLVTLDGTPSFDPESGDLLYEWRELIDGVPGAVLTLDPEYSRTTSFDLTQTFQLRVTDCCDTVGLETFTQVTLPHMILSPKAGDSWGIGTTRSIEWTQDSLPTSRVIQVSRDGGAWETLTLSEPNDGQYDWNVSGPATGDAVIRVFRAGNPNSSIYSDSITIAVAGDVNGDGVVGFADLLELLAAWGPCVGDCPADFDGDGIVGFADLLVLLGGWS